MQNESNHESKHELEMQQCPHCLHMNNPRVKHCTRCGKEIKLRCRNCNLSMELPLKDKFCPSCGIKNPIIGQGHIIRRQKREAAIRQLKIAWNNQKMSNEKNGEAVNEKKVSCLWEN